MEHGVSSVGMAVEVDRKGQCSGFKWSCAMAWSEPWGSVGSVGSGGSGGSGGSVGGSVGGVGGVGGGGGGGGGGGVGGGVDGGGVRSDFCRNKKPMTPNTTRKNNNFVNRIIQQQQQRGHTHSKLQGCIFINSQTLLIKMLTLTTFQSI